MTPTKQPLRCEGNCQRRIYFSIALKGAQLHYSLIQLQFLRASDPKLAYVASKVPYRFAAATNKEISQLIKQAVPEIHEEGDEVRFESFNR